MLPVPVRFITPELPPIAHNHIEVLEDRLGARNRAFCFAEDLLN